MAQLKVTRASGEIQTFPITPIIEVAFEKWAKGGFSKIFRDNERATDIYWLAWECIRRSGEIVKPHDSDDFLGTLKSVEVIDDDPNG
jgi:hypothetical protein